MVDIEKCSIDGIEMRYFKFGDGPEKLVIIPGLSVKSVMGSAEAIIKAYGPTKDEFTIYVFDRRENYPSPYPVHEMAEDTVKVLRKLGVTRASFFGASQGGMISMDISVNHPEMVNKLVLGSTSARVQPEQLKVINEWISLAEKGDRQELYLRFGEALYKEEVFEQYRGYFMETAKTVTDSELEKFITCAESIRDFDLSGRLKEIKCPTMVIGDYNDEVLDADATMQIAENLDHMSDFKLFMYIGYGHAVYDMAPDYLKRVRDFLIG